MGNIQSNDHPHRVKATPERALWQRRHLGPGGVKIGGARRRFIVNVPPIVKTLIHTEIIATDQCSICKDIYSGKQVVSILPCAHIFHQQCITEWIQFNHNTCPICRKGFQNSIQQ